MVYYVAISKCFTLVAPKCEQYPPNYIFIDVHVFWRSKIEKYEIFVMHEQNIVKFFEVDYPFSISVYNGEKKFVCCRVEGNVLYGVKAQNGSIPVLHFRDPISKIECSTLDLLLNVKR